MKNLRKQLATLIILFCHLTTQELMAQDESQFSVPIKFSISGIPIFDLDTGYEGFAGNVTTYFGISRKLELGINLFHHQNSLVINNIESNSKNTGLAASIKYNAFQTKRFTYFVEGYLGYGYSRFRTDDKSDNDFLVNGYDGGIEIVSIGIGSSYKLSPKFHIDYRLNYLSVNNKNGRNSNFSQIFEGVAPMIGVSYKFN